MSVWRPEVFFFFWQGLSLNMELTDLLMLAGHGLQVYGPYSQQPRLQIHTDMLGFT